MHSIERSRQIREVDLFLFGGAAEVAEGDWERDTSINPHSPTRVVRRVALSHGPGTPTPSGHLIGTLVFDPKTRRVTFQRHEPSQS